MSCGVGNLFWGMQFALFLYKTALNRLQVLFRLFRIKTAQSHTAITSIVFALYYNLLSDFYLIPTHKMNLWVQSDKILI